MGSNLKSVLFFGGAIGAAVAAAALAGVTAILNRAKKGA